ncbi:uncharacterized protein LOC120105596 [Phoenix dactylifera]|uniref:Uncharacterized protein LOC120105596 n=1 Tax=Phoenix dactylifera TaxID=42345 RepID=A0A8B8ZRN4_PHODC|nr:uncharacterized protein LOC120105596 [Phoenix dactylifera]
MTKPEVSYHGLLGLLQTYEKDHQLKKESVNVVGGTSAGLSSFKKGKKKKVQKACAGVSKPKQTMKQKSDQSKAECFFCKKQGHWKRNCSAYLASLDPNRPKKKIQQTVAAQGTSSK